MRLHTITVRVNNTYLDKDGIHVEYHTGRVELLLITQSLEIRIINFN